jgi:putative ABC transport system permease protein
MRWFARLFRRGQIERDLADEIRQHLEEREDELVAEGLSRDDARTAARKAFGNVTLIEEDGRAVWRWQLVEDALADLRYAIRQLRATPSFSTAAMLTLALGIGANAAVFSVVRAVVLQPLPFPDPARLVSVQSIDVRGGAHVTNLSYPTFFDFRRAAVFAGMASYRDEQFTLEGRDGPRVVQGQIVSADLFDVLRVRPALGRGFTRADERAGTHVVVLGHGLWHAQFGGDPSVVGRSLPIDGEPYLVVGVAPEGFSFPIESRPTEIWTTLARDASSDTVQPVTEQRGARMLGAVARLAADESLSRARERLDAVAAALARQYPDSNANVPRTSVEPELEHTTANARLALLVLWAAVTVVLLIACANLANMLLARTADRYRELGIRLAIGGSRGRVVRQLVTENLLIGTAGAALGLVVAHLVLRTLMPLAADAMPRSGDVAVNAGVALVAASLAVVTTILVSLPLAFRVGRLDFGGALHAAPRGAPEERDRLRGGLVIAQVAFGLVLMSGAVTLGAGLRHLTHRDLGFRPDRLVTFGTSVPSRYTSEQSVAFTARLLDEVRAIPGVTAAAGAVPLPLTGRQMQVSFNIPERPTPPSGRPSSDMAIVTVGYFTAIGAPLVAGRTFTEQDDEHHARVVVVNRAFAARFFPGEQAVGKVIQPGATSHLDPPDGSASRRRIVGVVGDVRQSALGQEPEAIYYLPYRQMPWMVPSLVVRVEAGTTNVDRLFRGALATIDPHVPMHDLRTFDQVLANGTSGPRFGAILLGGFAGLALLLVATGLYGVLT